MRLPLGVLLACLVAVSACGADDRPSLADADATAIGGDTPVPVQTPTPVPPTPTPEPTSTPLPTPTPTPSCTDTISTDFAVGQLLLPLGAPEEFELIQPLAESRQVSGVLVLGAPTLDDLDQLPTVDDGGVPLILASDEEGGSVQRLGHLLGPLPAASTLSSVPVADVVTSYEDYGRAMAEIGFTMALAPVLDVGGGPGIGNRAFSEDPDVVAEYGAAVAQGYRQAGIVPVLKHFPGHGGASADSHLDVSTTSPIDQLRERDLLPFQALLSPDAVVLVGHLLVPGLTEDLPTSLSPDAIDGLLRTELGFDGVVMTDALGMNAVSDRWSNEEAAVLALAAGADVVVLETPAQVVPVSEAIAEALADGRLSREQIVASTERVLEMKGSTVCDLAGS